MNKQILLIGNNDGLPGVEIDILNYKNYFLSSKGGNWFENEIIVGLNISKNTLSSYLDILKIQQLDYLIIIFSGHGGLRKNTCIGLNSQGEEIDESFLHNIGRRQLTILDCCRVPIATKSALSGFRETMDFSQTPSTRKRFENRIMEAVWQEVNIYSCSKGESSMDTIQGGAYSKNLLETAQEDRDEFISLGNTHLIAAKKTTNQFPYQHPEIIQPRLMPQQQLIFGIN